MKTNPHQLPIGKRERYYCEKQDKTAQREKMMRKKGTFQRQWDRYVELLMEDEP